MRAATIPFRIDPAGAPKKRWSGWHDKREIAATCVSHCLAGIMRSAGLLAISFVALLLLLASTAVPYAYAQTVIVFDTAASTFCSTGGPTCGITLSWSHTVGSGSNRILVVGVAINADGIPQISGISYGSSSLTALPTSAPNWIAMYYLLNPPIGTRTVTVTFDMIPPRSVSAGSISYFNVATVGSTSSETDVSTLATVAVSSNAGDLVVDILSAGYGALPPALGPGQTLRWQESTFGAMSDKIGVSPSTSMTWTLAGGAYRGIWRLIAVTLVPAAAPTLVSGPVGGFMEPVNKLAVIAPWLAVIGIVGCCICTIVVVKKRRP